MHNDISAMLKRANQIRRCHRIVDNQRQAVFVRDGGNRLDVNECPARIRKTFDENGLGPFIDLRTKALRIRRIRPANLPAEILE